MRPVAADETIRLHLVRERTSSASLPRNAKGANGLNLARAYDSWQSITAAPPSPDSLPRAPNPTCRKCPL
ncbi:hypothetical protein GCM10009574_076240 [Streptomyces asiaticus]|uniref:Uncharacterized protein n=2 Tax=Streptomyces rhizosphaericus TaxID=114699 RepID=A0ABN1SB86_9ACTN